MKIKSINYIKTFDAVKRFVKNNNVNDINYESLSAAIEKEGYTIISFLPHANDKHVEKLIKALGLSDQTLSSDAFTYVDSEFRLIFIKSSLNDEEKCIVLTHEIGHIICKHFNHGTILGNSVIEEREASFFSMILLNYKSIKRIGLLSIIIVPVLVILYLTKK